MNTNEDKQLEILLNRLLSDLYVAKHNITHAKLFIKGAGSIHLRKEYCFYIKLLNENIELLSNRIVILNFRPHTSMNDLSNSATMKPLKPSSFNTVPAVLDTFIHLTENIADVHSLLLTLEDEVSAEILILMNKEFEKIIWELKNEFSKPE